MRAALELKACPFCGNAQGEMHGPEMVSGMGESWIHCTNCDTTSKMCMSEASAQHVWNRRSPDGTKAACRAAVEKQLIHGALSLQGKTAMEQADAVLAAIDAVEVR